MSDSIMATVRGRNCDRDHLPVRAAEFSGSMHSNVISRKVSLQHLRRQAVDLENVSHSAGALALFVVNAPEVARGIVLVDSSDPRHD
jgi:hypothetical protein